MEKVIFYMVMKRSPLRRKTPLVRNRSTLIRKKFIRKVSKHRAKDNRVYYQLRTDFLSENEFCEVCHQYGRIVHATEIHHGLGRSGKSFLDTKTWIPVCHTCHVWVEENKLEARMQGWLGNKHTGQIGNNAGNCQNVFREPKSD